MKAAAAKEAAAMKEQKNLISTILARNFVT